MDVLENSTIRLQTVAYIRRMLGIQHVNMDRLVADTSRVVPDGAAYVFSDTFKFYLKVLPNNACVFSPDNC